MPRNTKPTLAVVNARPAADGLPTPAGLGKVGTALWLAVTKDYGFDDPASIETLRQACAASDRAEACSQAISEDGELIRTKSGVRDHPLIKHELQARAFVVRTLAKLGLDLEPVRAGPGRPPALS